MSGSVWVLAVALTVASTSVAAADDTHGGTNDNGLWVSQAREAKGAGGGAEQDGGGTTDSDAPQVPAGAAACWGADPIVGDLVQFTFCPADRPQVAQPALTVGLIRRAFAELRLPAGELVIQPPDGLTLVNFDTNFYTTSTAPIARTVTLLGQRVTLEATPATYHWDFGDGRKLSTSEPGAPYPRLDVTHSYLRTGTYRPSLSTTYTGRYRVGGGAWQQIPGTVTIDGAGRPLRAIEAQPKLVGY